MELAKLNYFFFIFILDLNLVYYVFSVSIV